MSTHGHFKDSRTLKNFLEVLKLQYRIQTDYSRDVTNDWSEENAFKTARKVLEKVGIRGDGIVAEGMKSVLYWHL